MAQRTKARGPISDETKLLEAPPPDLATAADAATNTGGGGGGPYEMVESFYVHSIASLAEVAAVNAFSVGVLLRETGMFADSRPGQGIEGRFPISEAFTLAVWGELSRCAGVSLARASRIVQNNLDVYGMMRHGWARLPLSLAPERLGQPPWGRETCTITVNLWEVWLQFWPRFRDYAVRESRDPNMRAACALFEDRMQRVREAIAAGLSCA